MYTMDHSEPMPYVHGECKWVSSEFPSQIDLPYILPKVPIRPAALSMDKCKWMFRVAGT